MSSLTTIQEESTDETRKEQVRNKILRIAPGLILTILVIVFSLLIPGFFSTDNLMAVLNQMATPMIAACGVTFVILTGSIDLSVEGTMGLCGAVVSLLVLNSKTALALGWAGVGLALMLGGLVGMIIGVIYVKARIPSFILTFGMANIALGVALIFYGGVPADVNDPALRALVQKTFWGIPGATWVALGVLLIAYILEAHTAFGRHILAVGNNEKIPRMSGVDIDRVKILAFTWSGLCIGMAGILNTARLGRGTILVGKDSLFLVLTAIVVGGTSLAGGKGGVIYTLCGVFIVTVLQNGMILIGVDPFYQTAIQGAIIITAVGATAKRGRQVIAK